MSERSQRWKDAAHEWRDRALYLTYLALEDDEEAERHERRRAVRAAERALRATDA